MSRLTGVRSTAPLAAAITRQRAEKLRRCPAILIAGASDVLLFSGRADGKGGRVLFEHACEMDLEGIVSKRVASQYRSGPFDGWRKVKCPTYQRV